MRVAGIRNFQPRCTILPEKKKQNKQSFMEEEDQNRMLTARKTLPTEQTPTPVAAYITMAQP